MTAGDPQMAYRIYGLMLQNLGDTGGRSTALKDYDYGRLGEWFFLEDSLDERSNYIPMLAAFYFGATQSGEDLVPVIDYLEAAGRHPYEQKWRWLAHAVYLARHGEDNMGRALELANELAALWQPGRPAWMRQMPALILTAEGDRQAAYDIMLGILKSGAEKMDPAEVFYTRDYICNTILSAGEAAANPLCKDVKRPEDQPHDGP